MNYLSNDDLSFKATNKTPHDTSTEQKWTKVTELKLKYFPKFTLDSSWQSSLESKPDLGVDESWNWNTGLFDPMLDSTYVAVEV